MPQQHSGRGPGQQAQKKKRPQKGLEENIRRTVYISYVDCSLTGEAGGGGAVDEGWRRWR